MSPKRQKKFVKFSKYIKGKFLNEEVARLRKKDLKQMDMYNDQDWNYFAKKS